MLNLSLLLQLLCKSCFNGCFPSLLLTDFIWDRVRVKWSWPKLCKFLWNIYFSVTHLMGYYPILVHIFPHKSPLRKKTVICSLRILTHLGCFPLGCWAECCAVGVFQSRDLTENPMQTHFCACSQQPVFQAFMPSNSLPGGMGCCK